MSELLKIAMLAKTAWTARDKFQAIWRAAGGYAKESQPWSKAFTPGLTPQIENNVVSKLSDNPDLQRKYTELLAARSSKVYDGHDLSRGLRETKDGVGDSAYRNLGVPHKEVNTAKGLNGIHRYTVDTLKDLIDTNRAKGISVTGQLTQDPSEAGVTIGYNMLTGSVNKKNINLINASKAPDRSSKIEGIISNRHELEEYKRTNVRPITRFYQGKKQIVYDSASIGSHASYGVLGHEQVALRDVPDSTYNFYVAKRTTGNNGYFANDQDKLDMLTRNHGVTVTPYGTDLRYNPKDVKNVDRAMNRQHDKHTYYKSLYQNIAGKMLDNPNISDKRSDKIIDYLNGRLNSPGLESTEH